MTVSRIALVGPVASGKSTLSAAISAHTALPRIDLDELFWGPNWTPLDTPIFHKGVRDRLAGPAWIADGNYGGEVAEILLDRAELVLWLDLPLRVCLPRLGGVLGCDQFVGLVLVAGPDPVDRLV
ncbi:hypothetical protein OIU91_04665 [Streptomyces sp. NBC_01456]|uniref:hypothetical protein n=1 Tax=unclassified Streptomyces TaxID=2593676 RepID=UPI002E32D805|nr:MULTISPECIES: hypothetical protein [unclassified Streptomyces]